MRRPVALLGLLALPGSALLGSCAAGAGTPGAATPVAAVDGAAAADGPTAAPRARPARPVAAASTTGPGTTRATAPPATTASPTGSPTAAGPCLPLYGPGTPVPVDVAASATSVVMTWWHNGDPAAVAYWVGVQPMAWATPATPGADLSAVPVVWTRVPPPQGCRTVTFTVPGIAAGSEYSVLLDLEARTPETRAGVSRRGLNRVSWVRLR